MDWSIHELPRAMRDIVDLYAYIEADSPNAAGRFLDALDRAYSGLRRYPLSGHLLETLNPRLAGLRIGRLPGFPNHLILYRAQLDTRVIDVLRVVHGAREIDSALDESVR